MIEPRTVRVLITQNDAAFFEGDVEVYPWHIGNYGGNWTLWLEKVAPEWVDRTAGGIRAQEFRATATDADSSEELATVGFTHTAAA